MRSGPRALLLILLLLAGLALAGALLLDRRGRLPREQLAQWWNRRLLAILNVKLRVTGQPVNAPQLTVVNHVSWLDINIIGALLPTRFVSKSEVRDWPIAGSLADAYGTFYLHRGKGGSKPLLEKLVPHLRKGGSVTLFPEGTTTDGSSVRPFHPRLFAAAVDSGCRVQPVALCYAPGSVAPFIGEDTLASHILRVLQEPAIHVDVMFCPALSTIEADRDELAHAAEYSIRRVVEAVSLEALRYTDVAAELTPA